MANTIDEFANMYGLTGGGIPSGCILMWSGTIATIPSGYVLCDGNNGTPNLLNRFIVCADADVGGVAKTTVSITAAQTGGTASHTHNDHAAFNLALVHTVGQPTITDHPKITPTGKVSAIAKASDTGVYVYTSGTRGASTVTHTHPAPTLTMDEAAAVTHSLSGNVTVGNHTDSIAKQTHSTAYSLSPYYALAYIMKT